MDHHLLHHHRSFSFKSRASSDKYLFKLNRLVVTIAAYWASVSTELGLPTKTWLVCIDRVTQIWSLIILVTSLFKFFKFPEATDSLYGITVPSTRLTGNSNATQQSGKHRLSSYTIVKDVLILNYLPRINDFGKLYFGLVSISIGAALIWRIYLSFFRPKATIIDLAEGSRTRANKGAANSTIRRPPAATRFNAKIELIDFFMGGPDEELDQASKQLLNSRRHGINFEQLISVRHLASQLAKQKFHKLPSLDPMKLPKQTGLLSRQYQRNSSIEIYEHQMEHLIRLKQLQESPDGSRGGCCCCYYYQSPHESKAVAATTMADKLDRETRQTLDLSGLQMYRIPIGSANFLDDRSALRWNFLATFTFSFMLFVLVVSIPVFYYCITALSSIHKNFGLGYQHPVYDWLLIYGSFEQAYALTQGAMFFIFTNIFITMFLADLIYKLLPIRREVYIISRLYKLGHVRQLTREEVYRQQLRLWAYFDYIKLLDNFVSKYAIVSMATLIIGLSFGQSYLKIEDTLLRAGTASALGSNFLSLTYLHLISWLIEEQSIPIHKNLLSILARELDHEAKRDWQKTLFGFFAPDWSRTFTLGGRYPLNLHSYFRTIFGLATISLVINRLFIKRTWEASFVHGHQN